MPIFSGHPRLKPILSRLPALSGDRIRLHTKPGLRDRHGPVHAGSFLRQRRIALNCSARELPRIFVHELAHFIWFRLGNPRRHDFERLLAAEVAAEVPGELGWSAEWRKLALRPSSPIARTRQWREYCCEAFCDTAAWRYSGVRRHGEFTLPAAARRVRRAWFAKYLDGRTISI